MKKKRILSWILLIAWMALIFFFSNQPGGKSSNLSNRVLKALESLLHIPLTNDFFSVLIRKLAHFTEYAVLGILVVHLLSQYQNIGFKKANYVKIFFCIFFCFFYAATDEFHQLFILGRSGQWMDVLLDTCGSTFGIINYLILKHFKKIHV